MAVTNFHSRCSRNRHQAQNVETTSPCWNRELAKEDSFSTSLVVDPWVSPAGDGDSLLAGSLSLPDGITVVSALINFFRAT